MKQTEKRPFDTLTARQKKIYGFLCSGWCSVVDLVRYSGFSDPRGYIRDLRNKGIAVTDKWKTTTEGARYKVYHITINL